MATARIRSGNGKSTKTYSNKKRIYSSFHIVDRFEFQKSYCLYVLYLLFNYVDSLSVCAISIINFLFKSEQNGRRINNLLRKPLETNYKTITKIEYSIELINLNFSG